MKIRNILLPFLIACYPISSLLAENIDWVQPADAARSLLITLIAAILLLLLARLITKDWGKASLMAALAILIFFSYGHIYAMVRSLPNGITISRHRYLIPIWIAVFALFSFLILRHRGALDTLIGYLSIVAGIALVFPIYSIASYKLAPDPSTATQSKPPIHLTVNDEVLPDIYYIILDAYAREDVLNTIFEYDNAPFITALEERGFYVVPDARSNHAQTSLSLTSSLNMEYVQALVPHADPKSSNREPLWNLIQHSEVRRALENAGYETVTFSTGFPGSDIQDSDYYFAPSTTTIVPQFISANAFEGLLLDTSAAKIITDASTLLPRFFPDFKYPYKIHQARILNILDTLPEIPDIESPTFAFAHVLAPHAPFVFGAEGQLLEPEQPYNLRFKLEGDDEEELKQYIEGYNDQVTYLNARMLPIIDEILEGSETPPIIIIQGDHGPAAESGKLSYVTERMRIFNAILVAPEVSEKLYADLTPVNTFRLLFNAYFDAGLQLLPDNSYYSEYQTPYNFTDVTGSVDS